MTIAELLQHQNALPSAPKIVEELIASFDDPSVSVDTIARKIALDPVLAAKLLRLANSAYYHVSRNIASVDDAVRMLGFVTVRTLVISSGLVGSFKHVPGVDLKEFWRYSLHTAVAAKWIARQAHENQDLAFTIGMMHAIGQLVIHAGAPEQAKEVDAVAGPFAPERLEQERSVLGFDSAGVGAELAVRWKFPLIFAETIRSYPAPLPLTPVNRIAGVLHLAVRQAQGTKEASAEVEQALGLLPEELAGMPALTELAAGLDELVNN